MPTGFTTPPTGPPRRRSWSSGCGEKKPRARPVFAVTAAARAYSASQTCRSAASARRIATSPGPRTSASPSARGSGVDCVGIINERGKARGESEREGAENDATDRRRFGTKSGVFFVCNARDACASGHGRGRRLGQPVHRARGALGRPQLAPMSGCCCDRTSRAAGQLPKCYCQVRGA